MTLQFELEVTNPRLRALCAHMCSDLVVAFEDQESEMHKAITKMMESRDPESEAPLKFAVSMSGKLDLDKNAVETQLGFSVKTTVKEKHKLEDPGQPDLL